MDFVNEQWWSVKVPISMLTDRHLPLAARGLYLVLLGLCPPKTFQADVSRPELAELGGFSSRNTVAAHLKKLESSGWIIANPGRRYTTPVIHLVTPAGPIPAVQTIKLPGSLLHLPSINPQAKWLYAYVLWQCSQCKGELSIHQTNLMEIASVGSDRTLRALVLQLERHGWLAQPRRRGFGSSVYATLDPHWTARDQEMQRDRMDIEGATYKGEVLLKEMLNLLVVDRNFEDNIRLRAFTNPLTGERLELDRWYREARVAIEFNGPQHYHTTATFPDQNQVDQQQARDLMKESMARRNGITFITLEAVDLLFARLRQLLNGILPLRELKFEDPAVRYLHSYSQSYVQAVRNRLL